MPYNFLLHLLSWIIDDTKKLLLLSNRSPWKVYRFETKGKRGKQDSSHTVVFCQKLGQIFPYPKKEIVYIFRRIQQCAVSLLSFVLLNENVAFFLVGGSHTVLIPSNDLSCISPLHNRPIKAASYVPSSAWISQALAATAVGLSSRLSDDVDDFRAFSSNLDARKRRWPTSYKIPPHSFNETSIDDKQWLTPHRPIKADCSTKR